MKVILLLCLALTVVHSVVPKQVLKHGLMAFLQELMEPKQDNLCFKVFEAYAEAILDEGQDFNEAFDVIFRLDLTHTYAKNHCQKAFEKFQELWKHYQVTDNKFVAIWGGIQAYIEDFWTKNLKLKNDDYCLRFLHQVSSKIVEQGKPELIKTSHVDFSKALLNTGLQYLNGDFQHVPCVKSLGVMTKYSTEIKSWISQILAMEEPEENLSDLLMGKSHQEL